MPNRFIEVPASVLLVDPSTGKPILDESDKEQSWDFDFVMAKLMSNPMWGESFAAMRSQDAIYDAWKNTKDGVMVLAEEDWTRLKQAVETPKTTVPTVGGGQVVNGYGVHPTLARLLLPLLSAIVDAKSERPKAKLAPVPETAPKSE